MPRPDGTFLTGLLTGALVGASLAMVLVPASSDDTRTRLRAQARAAEERVARGSEAAAP